MKTTLTLAILSSISLAATSRAFEEIPIEYASSGALIAASLVVPDAAPPYPVAVFLHGSGPHTRDEQRPYSRFFLDSGVAVLLSDKRGSGSSTGSWQTSSLQDLARDAVAGIRVLRERSDIDSTRIGLFGGSQAGWVAPIVNQLDSQVAFFVLASGGGVRPIDNERWAYERALERRGATEADKSKARRLLDRYFDYLARGEGRDDLEEALATARSEPWYEALNLHRILPSEESRTAWQWVATFDPLPLIEKMKTPTLLLFGALDEMQPTELSAARWREGLTAANNEMFDVRVFPEANHSLRVRARMEHGAEPHGRSALAPFVSELGPTVRSWLEEHVVKEKR